MQINAAQLYNFLDAVVYVNRSPSQKEILISVATNGIFFFQINKQRRLNPNSLDQQRSTATISKYKLQALFPKPPHNGCSNLPERG